MPTYPAPKKKKLITNILNTQLVVLCIILISPRIHIRLIEPSNNDRKRAIPSSHVFVHFSQWFYLFSMLSNDATLDTPSKRITKVYFVVHSIDGEFQGYNIVDRKILITCYFVLFLFVIKLKEHNGENADNIISDS